VVVVKLRKQARVHSHIWLHHSVTQWTWQKEKPRKNIVSNMDDPTNKPVNTCNTVAWVWCAKNWNHTRTCDTYFGSTTGKPIPMWYPINKWQVTSWLGKLQGDITSKDKSDDEAMVNDVAKPSKPGQSRLAWKVPSVKSGPAVKSLHCQMGYHISLRILAANAPAISSFYIILSHLI